MPSQEREQEAWPAALWANRFNDLPLEWWANPSTVEAPKPIAGHPVEARRYLPAQAVQPLMEVLKMTLDSMLADGIAGESDRDATIRIHCKWAVEKALTDFKALTEGSDD